LSALQTKYSSQTDSADARLLSAHPPHGTKPHQQRLPGALHDCSGYQRCLVVAAGTFNKVALISPPMAMATAGAPKTLWPALREKILSAGFFTIESLVKLHQVSWKIRTTSVPHAPILQRTLA
jgi:hypothetical protein